MNIAVLTDVLTPYRISFYRKMFEVCNESSDCFVTLVMGNSSSYRRWTYDEYKEEFTVLLKNKHLVINRIDVYINPIIKTLKEYKIDLLICGGTFFQPSVILSSLFKGNRYRCLFWSESHLDEKRSYNKLLLWITQIVRKNIYRRFDGFFYAGKLSKEFINAYAQPEAKYIYVPNLIEESVYSKAFYITDVEKNRIKNKYNISKERIIFISARLDKEKGIIEFLQLVKKCTNKDKVEIIIAGEGKEKELIIKEIRKEGLNVQLVGYKTQSEMVELYGIADFFALPSLRDPNPLSCIEALWSGLPLYLSSHVGNWHEVVESGINGYVFSYNKIRDAVNKLEKMIDESNEWYKNAREVSYSKAENCYNTEKECRRIVGELKVYEK